MQNPNRNDLKVTRDEDELIPIPSVKKVALDVLKPHQPTLPELALQIVTCIKVNRVNISSVEIDQNTETIKVIVEGKDVKIKTIRKCLEDLGATIHSIDEVEVIREA